LARPSDDASDNGDDAKLIVRDSHLSAAIDAIDELLVAGSLITRTLLGASTPASPS
jgi:hypothetical protein